MGTKMYSEVDQKNEALRIMVQEKIETVLPQCGHMDMLQLRDSIVRGVLEINSKPAIAPILAEAPTSTEGVS